MAKHSRSSSPSGMLPPEKLPRNNKACLSCRSRKQRCLPPPPPEDNEEDAAPQPCLRCKHLSMHCSLEDEPFGADANNSSLVGQIAILQRKVREQDGRIARLEGRFQHTRERNDSVAGNKNGTQLSNEHSPIMPRASIAEHSSLSTPHSMHSRADSITVDLSTVKLASPFVTLRSIGEGFEVPASDALMNRDPVACGLLSEKEAERAVSIYFERCHPSAPFLDERNRRHPLSMRRSSPSVFVAVCSIAARYWSTSPMEPVGLHPNLSHLVAMYDAAIARLLLHPLPSDVTLDSVQALLLYAQWMPYTLPAIENGASIPPSKSRYNDISAWSVLGLAARYANVLNLHKNINPQEVSASPAETARINASRLRAFCNLTSCDFNLMLSSGLPVSIDPIFAARRVNELTAHQSGQMPGDLRITALVELVSLTHRALKSRNDFSGRNLGASSLKVLNAQLDQWETTWASKLKNTESQHDQLPYTSVRWYRLALNSASLASLLSTEEDQSKPQESQVALMQSLETSLTAATQIIFSHSTAAPDYVWTLDSQQPASFPNGYFSVDKASIERMRFAVDSAWVGHAFAATFLVLCYVKRVISDDMRLAAVGSTQNGRVCYPQNPRPHSILARIVNLALDIFEHTSHNDVCCPGRDFLPVLQHAASLIGLRGSAPETEAARNDFGPQTFWTLMNESGIDWPASLFDLEDENTSPWIFSGLEPGMTTG